MRATLELSTNSSQNNYSIKVIRPVSVSGTSGIQIRPTLTEQDIGKQITISCDINTPNNPVAIQIFSNAYDNLNVPINDGFYTYQVSHEISTTTTIIAVYMNVSETEQYYYIDNVNVNIQ